VTAAQQTVHRRRRGPKKGRTVGRRRCNLRIRRALWPQNRKGLFVGRRGDSGAARAGMILWACVSVGFT